MVFVLNVRMSRSVAVLFGKESDTRMKCPKCGGKGILHEWIQEPCAYCGGTGELPDDFSEMTKLKRCKKCGGEAVFSGVFDDPTTYRFPECMKCGARAEGNSVKDSWYERARKWNEQNTLTEQEYIQTCNTEQLAQFLYDIRHDYQVPWKNKGVVEWLKQPHNSSK